MRIRPLLLLKQSFEISLILFLLLLLFPLATFAQSLGVTASQTDGTVTVFDDSGVLGSVTTQSGGFPLVGDCAITPDASTVLVTNFAPQLLYVVDITDPANPVVVNSIDLPLRPEDVSLTPDGRYAVVTGPGPVSPNDSPVVVVDLTTETIVDTWPTELDGQSNAVEVCDDGVSVLVTFNDPDIVRRLTIDATGTLTDTGETLAISSPQGVNIDCAPGSASGAVIGAYFGDVQSFSIPGLAQQDTLDAPSWGNGIRFHPAGNLMFIRDGNPGTGIYAYEYTAATGVIGPLQFSINGGFDPNPVGIESFAISPDGLTLTASDNINDQVVTYSTVDGSVVALPAAFSVPIRPTGVCYAPQSDVIWKEVTSGPDEFEPTNILSHGDFETGALGGAEFRLGISDFNKWYRLSPWQYEPINGNQYLDHAPFGGSDQRAFQVIDASGMVAGTRLLLEFDYIYNEGDLQQQGVYVGIVGIKDDGLGTPTPGPCDNPDPARYAAYGGTGWDGWKFNWCPCTNPADPSSCLPKDPINPDAYVLATSAALDVTPENTFGDGWLEAVIDQEYDAIVVVLRADSWQGNGSGVDEGIRGFDNIRLYASDGLIDKVVEIKPNEPIHYDFTIYYNGPTEDVAVVDTIPAEWDVTKADETIISPPLDCGESTDIYRDSTMIGELFRGGKADKKCRSATNLWWTDFPVNYLRIDSETRLNPGKGHEEDVYAPTSCGALNLNEGAAVYPAEDGEPLLYEEPLHVSNALCVAAIYDVNEDGEIARDGTGDEDGDGFSDYEEACEIGSDPCVFDHSDGDGVPDNADNCPYVDNPGQEDYDGNGVGDACEPCPCFIGIAADSPYFETAISGTNLCPDGITSIEYPVFYFNFTDESIGTVGVGFQEYCDAPTEYFCGGGPAGSFSLSLDQYEACVVGPGWEPVASPD